MSNYVCPRCLREFTRKQSLNYHISSKTACKFACIAENLQIKNFLKENQSDPTPPRWWRPENLGNIPVKITKNSLKIPEKLENFEKNSEKRPENSRLSEKKLSVGKKVKQCPDCHKTFSRNDALSRHLKSHCQTRKTSQIESDLHELEMKLETKLETKFNQRIEELEKEQQRLEELAKEPRVTNNILNVVCVGPNDNYLDMLTDYCGFDRALEYVKGCALSDINGDVRLIQKIYFGGNQDNPPIRLLNKKSGRVLFYDENHKQVEDPDGYILSQRLGHNLQNTYLKGINHLITKNIESNLCPNKFLDEFDLLTWNQHIYDLSDLERRRKIVKQLAQIS